MTYATVWKEIGGNSVMMTDVGASWAHGEQLDMSCSMVSVSGQKSYQHCRRRSQKAWRVVRHEFQHVFSECWKVGQEFV